MASKKPKKDATPEELDAMKAQLEADAAAKAEAKLEAKRADMRSKGMSEEAIAKVLAKQAKTKAAVSESRKRTSEGGRAVTASGAPAGRPSTADRRAGMKAERDALAASYRRPRRERYPGPPPELGDQVGQPIASPEARAAVRRTTIRRKYGRQYRPAAGEQEVDFSADGDYQVETIKTPNVETPINPQFTGSGGEGTVAGELQRARYLGVPPLSKSETSMVDPNNSQRAVPLPKDVLVHTIRASTRRHLVREMSNKPHDEQEVSEGRPTISPRTSPIRTTFRRTSDDPNDTSGQWVKVSEHPQTRGEVTSIGYLLDPVSKERNPDPKSYFNRLQFRPARDEQGNVVQAVPPPTVSVSPKTGETETLDLPDSPFTRARLEEAAGGPKVVKGRKLITTPSGEPLLDTEGNPRFTEILDPEVLASREVTRGDLARQAKEIVRLAGDQEAAPARDMYGSTSLDPSSDIPLTDEPSDKAYTESLILSDTESSEAAADAKAAKRQAARAAKAKTLPDAPKPRLKVKVAVTEFDKRIAAGKKARRQREREDTTGMVAKSRAEETAGQAARTRLEGLLFTEARSKKFPGVLDAGTPEYEARMAEILRNAPKPPVRGASIRSMTPTRELTADTAKTPQESALVTQVQGAIARRDNPVDARALAYGQPMGTPVEELSENGTRTKPLPPMISMGLSDDPVLRAHQQREAGLRSAPTIPTGPDKIGIPTTPTRPTVETVRPSLPPKPLGPGNVAAIAAHREEATARRAEREETVAKIRGVAKELLPQMQGFTGPNGEPIAVSREDLTLPEDYEGDRTGYSSSGQMLGPIGTVGRRSMFEAHVAAAKQVGAYKVVREKGATRQVIGRGGRVLSESVSNLD